MKGDDAPPPDESVRVLLAELHDAAGCLNELADGTDDPADLTRLARVGDALRRAEGALEHQDRVLRALAGAVGGLGRQLVDVHARVAEWATEAADGSDRAPAADGNATQC